MLSNIRQRLIQKFEKNEDTILFFEGGSEETRNDTDTELPFRQESNFHYLFGVNEMDCYGIIDVKTELTTLFFPRLDLKHSIWTGKVLPLDYYKNLYKVDDVRYTDEIDTWLSIRGPKSIHIIHTNNYSTRKILPMKYNKLDNYDVKRDVLYNKLCECRLVKTDDEIEILKKINKISSDAHIIVIKECKNKKYEYELEAIFQNYCLSEFNCRLLAYQSIVASNGNSAVLHYMKNDDILNGLVLCDMGAEYQCYASDITRTFPANGKFTEKQKQIYNIVLHTQESVIKMLKAGIKWIDTFDLTHKLIVEGLYQLGLINDPTEYKLIAKYFFPHDISHFMGKDVHDVRHYYHDKKTLVYQTGNVITVEPGIYFIEPLLEQAYQSNLKQYFNKEIIDTYMDIGGIRIEDDIIITNDGHYNLTTVPKTVEDIEALAALL